jgi:hypothetical protein
MKSFPDKFYKKDKNQNDIYTYVIRQIKLIDNSSNVEKDVCHIKRESSNLTLFKQKSGSISNE